MSPPRPVHPAVRRSLVIGLAVACFCFAYSATSAEPKPSVAAERVVLPKAVPDPIEPLNRVVWGFNRWLMSSMIKPTARLYRAIVRKPVRTGINNFNRNITYPGRLINNLLQGKCKGARNETDRFFVNTIAGGAGFVDVASRWKMPKSDADFGQTFGKWGWKPGCYVMLPVFGPSNERDAIGFVADTGANPITYLTPYPFTPNDPLTYLTPYTYYSAAATYNGLSDTVDGYVRGIAAEKDAYATLQYAWTFVRANRTPDFQIKGEQDRATLETLQSALVKVKDPEFPNRSATRSSTACHASQEIKSSSVTRSAKASSLRTLSHARSRMKPVGCTRSWRCVASVSCYWRQDCRSSSRNPHELKALVCAPSTAPRSCSQRQFGPQACSCS